MSDLNKNKIIFKSEQAIREHVSQMVDDSFLPSDVEPNLSPAHCLDVTEQSIRHAVEILGKERVVEDQVKMMLRQQQLDPNIAVYESNLTQSNRHSSQFDPLQNSNYCYEVKVNIIVNAEAPIPQNNVSAVLGGAHPYNHTSRPLWNTIGGQNGIIDALNQGFSEDSAGTGTYAALKALGCGIRFKLEHFTELTGNQCVAWNSDVDLYTNVQLANPTFYGLKENCINIYVSDFISPKPSDVVYGAWGSAINGTLGGGMMNFPTFNFHNTYHLVGIKETLIHEMGHNLNLLHVFGMCGAGNMSACNCGDDGVSDTPLQKPTVIGSTPGVTLQDGPPWTVTNLCGDGDGDGAADDSFPENWMDYSFIKSNRGFFWQKDKFFSEGQKSRMQALLDTYPEYTRIVNCTAGDPNPGTVVDNNPGGQQGGGGGGGGGAGGGGPVTVVDNALLFSGKSLSTQIENKFFGENFGNYLKVHRHTFKGRIDSRSANTDFAGTKESLASMESILAAAHNKTTEGFKIIGDPGDAKGGIGPGGIIDVECVPVDLGRGKIISVDFSENTNPVRLHDYTIVFECYHQGNLSNEFNENIFGTALATEFSSNRKMEHLESFSENFSFDTKEDQGFEYSHSLNFKYNSGENGIDYVGQAKSLATSVLNTYEPEVPFVGPNARIYDDANIQAHEHRFDEKYDLYNLEFSFTKKFTQLGGRGTTASVKNSLSLTLDEEGFVSVSENGSIDARYVGDKASLLGVFQGTVGADYATAYARCQTEWKRMQDAGWGDGAGPAYNPQFALEPTPISVSKGYDPVNAKYDYNLTFSNNPKYFIDAGNTHFNEAFVGSTNRNAVVREFNLSVSEDFEAKSLTVTENGTIKKKGVRSLTYDGWAHLLQMSTNTSPARILDFVIAYTNKNSHEQNEFRGKFASNIFKAETNYLFNWPAGKPQWDTMSIDYPKYGGAMNYTLTYVFDGKKIKRDTNLLHNLLTLEITDSNNEPVHHNNNFIIPNHGELTQQAIQSTIGTKDITLTAQFSNYLGARKNTDITPPNLRPEIAHLKELALQRVRSVQFEREEEIIRDIWITGSSHSFDNTSRILTLNLQVSWVAVNKQTQPNLKRYRNSGL